MWMRGISVGGRSFARDDEPGRRKRRRQADIRRKRSDSEQHIVPSTLYFWSQKEYAHIIFEYRLSETGVGADRIVC
jgi:hypothetical protein